MSGICVVLLGPRYLELGYALHVCCVTDISDIMPLPLGALICRRPAGVPMNEQVVHMGGLVVSDEALDYAMPHELSQELSVSERVAPKLVGWHG